MTCIDHPIGHLAHAESGRLTQLHLLVFVGVWMVRVAMQPIFEIIGRRLGDFPPLSFRPLGRGDRKGGNGIRGAECLLATSGWGFVSVPRGWPQTQVM